MPYAIMRVHKLKNAKAAKDATAHNYRQYLVLNADEQAPHPSVEFVNASERDYWELATERMNQAGISPRRSDAIRCVEVLLTASPEWFTRDAQGLVADYSQGKWVQDNLNYLKKTFGPENVLAFKLHQDEKSPHIHAIVAPITQDGRLSGRDLFGPGQLRKYQNSYAEAMAGHGLERGRENSQAEHQPMRRFYGQQAKTAQQVGELIGPVIHQPVKVDSPGRLQVNPQKWADGQSETVNGKFRPQLEEANRRAEAARCLALENAAAKDQVRSLQKELDASEKRRQAQTVQVDQLSGALAQTQGELAAAAGSLKQARLDRERFAVASYERRLVPELVAEGKEMEIVREAERRYALHPKVEAALAGRRFDAVGDYFKQVAGYSYREGKNGQPSRLHQLIHPNMSFTLAEARPDGATPLLQAVQEVIDARERARQQVQAREEQEARKRTEQARQALVTKELTLMQSAFEIYRWRITPEMLTVCLLVPDKYVGQVQKLLCTPGSYGQALSVQGEPRREDEKKAVYCHYNPHKAKWMTTIMEQVQQVGGEVFESVTTQIRREQAAAQAWPQRDVEQEGQPTPDREQDGISR